MTMTPKTCDVAVIGLGAMGSAALWQLARRGADVVGIERYETPHTHGSTHGETRMTRQGIGEGFAYVPLVLRSHEIWDELEAETGRKVLTRCGVIVISREDDEADRRGRTGFLTVTRDSARTFGIAHEMLNNDELNYRYPQFNTTRGESAYFEPGGGYVTPEGAVGAQIEMALRCGAKLKTGSQVTGIAREGDGVRITMADQSTLLAGQVILTAGSWARDFLPASLRDVFQPHRQMLHWFEIDSDAPNWAESPTYAWPHGNHLNDFFYGFPSLDGGGTIKMANEQYDALVDPDNFDREVSKAESAKVYADHVGGRLRGVSGRAVKSATCLYTVTPDSSFVIDYHPDMPNVQLVSPCSGHGFKHSAAIGEAVAERALEGKTRFDLSAFRLNRFNGAAEKD